MKVEMTAPGAKPGTPGDGAAGPNARDQPARPATARDEPARPAPRRPRPARLATGYVAVAALLPYLLLKLAWIAGSDVGISRTSPVDPEVLLAGNVVTLGMEVTAIAVILTFTQSWGLRVPAWLVLLPVWVGTGLLAPFVVT